MQISIRSLEKGKGLYMLEKRPVSRWKSALALFVPLKTRSAEAETYASSTAVSEHMNRSAVSRTRELLQPSSLLHTRVFLRWQIRTLIPSWILLFLSFLSSSSPGHCIKVQTEFIAPTSCHLIFRPCHGPENYFAFALWVSCSLMSSCNLKF